MKCFYYVCNGWDIKSRSILVSSILLHQIPQKRDLEGLLDGYISENKSEFGNRESLN